MPETTRTDRTAGEIDLPHWADRRDTRDSTTKFSVPIGETLDDLQHVLEERMSVIEWRLSTAAPQREEDGRPYARASPDYPGVVVRWSMPVPDSDNPGDFEVISQQWNSIRDNLREILKYFEEKTRMENRPIETRRSEFASARKELPPGDRDDAIVAESGQPSLSEDEAAELLGVHPESPARVVKTAFQELMKSEHPDQGGNGEPSRLQAAREKLLED